MNTTTPATGGLPTPETARPARAFTPTHGSVPSGADLIAAERARQISSEGWTPEHDDDHIGGEMASAAACYALPGRARWLEDAHIEMDAARGCADPAMPYTVKVRVPRHWPWDPEWWKPAPKDRVRELVKAGALIAAEIDRLQRARNTEVTNAGAKTETSQQHE